MTPGRESHSSAVDAVVVGAGSAGLYMSHRLRGLGLSVRVIEAGSGVGGTWYWNRYPDARCDTESMQYSYSFSPDLQQDWHWTEKFAGQPEILKYANYVADRFDLRRDITFNTFVTSAVYDEDDDQWAIRTGTGEDIRARFCIMATGCLSNARVPDFIGRDGFKGTTYHTGHWPHEGVDFSGKRVAVIGTGSSGIQCIPEIVKQAAQVYVFQRTPNYSIPARNHPMTPEHEQSWKSNYDERREMQRRSRTGNVNNLNDVSAMSVSEEDRQSQYTARWATGGTTFMASFNDLVTNKASNDTAAEFVRQRIGEIVRDPAVAARLTPRDYPIGTKRICADTHYFETFNRDNVTLIDIREDPIQEIVTSGVVAAGKTYEVDSIVFATGFDAMTGALLKVDIRGRGGESLRVKWEAGPRTYLGLATAGFPNLFIITGPGSPSVLSNMIVSIEQHVDWLTDCIGHMRARQLHVIEPVREAEDAWVEHVNKTANRTLYPSAASWYMGANIPGKPRVFMPYIGGVGRYRQECAEIAAKGYEGFRLAASSRAGAFQSED
jgi:cyclohexanone monooxygenase